MRKSHAHRGSFQASQRAAFSFGFIPNGGRVYYLRRSQPPLLTPMVYEYYEATHNKSFLNEILPTLEKELKFWDTQRTVKVKLEDGRMYKAYRYRTSSNVPRPESFKEDMETSIKMNDTERQFFYRVSTRQRTCYLCMFLIFNYLASF